MTVSVNVVPFRRDSSGVILLNAGDAHARIYSEWKHLDAWKTLDVYARMLLTDVLSDYTKTSGNEVRLTGNGLSKKYRIGHRRARNLMLMLEERGWIERIGLSPGPTGQAGGLYRILCITSGGKRCGGPYQTWRAPRS